MIRINSLEAENVKRIRAVKIEPTATGLTVVGGRNNQGKTSVLDAIAWALGGERYRPSAAQREGSTIPPRLKVTLSNGIVVERSGKNSSLKVTDPMGNKAGQKLLDAFVEELALDLPKFMEASGKEKARTLLQIIGVGDQLMALERKETELYNRRHAIGQIADQKKKYAQELPNYEGVPAEPVSASELIAQQQEILARNGENQRKRDQLAEITHAKHRYRDELERLDERIEMLKKQREELLEQYNTAASQEETARKTVLQLQDESTAELEENIRSIELVNMKVRANLDRERAEEESAEYARQYAVLTAQIDETRAEKLALLEGADLPLPGLSVQDGELTYKGQQWDNMSGSEQLMVATAIVRRLNPECGFVLLDKLEQMDLDTMRSFGAWLEQEGLQAIATRVSTGSECQIIIEDGYASAGPAAAQDAEGSEHFGCQRQAKPSVRSAQQTPGRIMPGEDGYASAGSAAAQAEPQPASTPTQESPKQWKAGEF